MFLRVDKDLFNKGLSPIEILIIAQIAEFEKNSGDCYMSDKVFSEQFGVSEKTVSRTLASLEERHIIIKSTKNVKGGKERRLKLYTTDNLSNV